MGKTNDPVHWQGLNCSPSHAEVFHRLLLSQTALCNPFSFIYSRLISLWPLALLSNRPETDKSLGTASEFDDVNHWTSGIFLTSHVPEHHKQNLPSAASGCQCPHQLFHYKPYTVHTTAHKWRQKANILLIFNLFSNLTPVLLWQLDLFSPG